MATASATLPAADLLPVSPRANFAYRLVRLVGIPLLKLCFRFQVTGRENIPHSGHYVVIANHLNWLDEFALLLLFPVDPGSTSSPTRRSSSIASSSGGSSG